MRLSRDEVFNNNSKEQALLHSIVSVTYRMELLTQFNFKRVDTDRNQIGVLRKRICRRLPTDEINWFPPEENKSFESVLGVSNTIRMPSFRRYLFAAKESAPSLAAKPKSPNLNSN